MRLKVFLIGLAVSLIFCKKTTACGYYEYDWENRPMTFRAALPSMDNMQPFWYTTAVRYHSMHPDPMSNDRKRNIGEWQKATSPDVKLDDIYVIQYETSATDFIMAYETDGLKAWAEKNTLVAYLIRDKKHKDLLEYLLFAKEAEVSVNDLQDPDFQFEEWGTVNAKTDEKRTQLFLRAEHKYKNVKSSFLKDRYAFQVARLGWESGNFETSSHIFKSHFGSVKPDNLMSAWAALFCAMSLDRQDRKAEANQLYIQCFDNCDEKKLRCAQMYNDTVQTPKWFTAKEKSIDAVIRSIQYPGRELDRMQQIETWNKNSSYMPFLVMREVCKLEDWLLSTVYWKSEEGTLGCKDKEPAYQRWFEDSAKNNQETDLKYLARLKSFILKLKAESKVQSYKDYYSLALAHLSLLEENKQDAVKYLAMISSKADESVQIQKVIEDAWIWVKTEDVTTERFKTGYLSKLKAIRKYLPEADNKENLSDPCYENSRVYFTLNLALANEFYKKGDIVSMCLLKTAYDFEQSYPKDYQVPAFASDYYGRLRLFDMYASTSDMDKLIILIEKQNKTDFEKFLCNQPFNKIDAYKDLKGTIAFRNGDLKLAFETFKSMDQQFWKNNYEYAMYLNEDPFVPKFFKTKRDFGYEFNKTRLVKSLLDLEVLAAGKDKKKVADAYLKLGHAYYNTSYYGNSWMMMSYGWSSGDSYYTPNPKETCASMWIKNYRTPVLAAGYYQKAYSMAQDKEQKAYATLMLVSCYSLSDDPKQNKPLITQYSNEYERLYRKKTLFDKQNECLLYEAFVK